jgi:hypothetical protein
MKRGGAGDGMSKNRHPAPTTRPRTRPIVPVIMIFRYLEGEAVAAQTPPTRLAMHPCVLPLTEGVKEMPRLQSRMRVVLIHARVSSISFNRRPVCGELLIFDTNQLFATHRLEFRGSACAV